MVVSITVTLVFNLYIVREHPFNLRGAMVLFFFYAHFRDRIFFSSQICRQKKKFPKKP